MLVPASNVSVIVEWMSIALWVVVSIPQFYENYALQSADAISLSSILIWVLADGSGLLAGLLAGMLPGMIVLGFWYVLCDFLLLVQLQYYHRKRIVEEKDMGYGSSERSRLLGSGKDERLLMRYIPNRKTLYVLAVVYVLGAGIAGAVLPEEEQGVPSTDNEVMEWKSQMIGWFSTSMYITSRFPQLILNTKTKCVGLSLDLHIFRIAANITYMWFIIAADMSKEHLMASASWLTASATLLSLDLAALYQFFFYRKYRRSASQVVV